MDIFLILLFTVILGIILVPATIRFAIKYNFLDKPNARKIHTKLIPRIGGIAIYISFIVGLISLNYFSDLLVDKQALYYSLLIGSSIIAVTGFIDDKIELSPKMKLIGQILAAIVPISLGVSMDNINNPFTGHIVELGLLSIPFTLIWIIAITNAINLVDGLDGLAGGISVISGIAIAVMAFLSGKVPEGYLALLLVTSIIGFLIFNFHPAKIFMGDTGSLFLGFVLSVLTLQELKQVTVVSFLIPILTLAIPILDTTYAIIRRKLKKAPIFQADKFHLHHQLLKTGLSQTKVVLIIYVIGIIFAITAILIQYINTIYAILIVLFLLIIFQIFARKIGMIREIKDTESKSR